MVPPPELPPELPPAAVAESAPPEPQLVNTAARSKGRRRAWRQSEDINIGAVKNQEAEGKGSAAERVGAMTRAAHEAAARAALTSLR